MKQIPLTRGLFALVDDEDFPELSRYKWQAMRQRHTWVAKRSLPRPSRKTVRMHREILNAPKSMLVDHRNGNGLDNQRSNLRVATYAQNGQNQRRKQPCTTSKFKGVCWSTLIGKWRADIRCGPVFKGRSRRKFLGHFTSEKEAAKAYDRAAAAAFADFACLNSEGVFQ